jgi:hypothetical protein
MRKLILKSSALSLAFGTALSVPTIALAQKTPDATIEQACAVVADESNGELTVAECVEMASSGSPAEVCRFLREEGYLDRDVNGVSLNQGRCVSFLTHHQNDMRKRSR